LVVKTALKLLLVFVEYTESNSLLFLAAISKVERAKSKHKIQNNLNQFQLNLLDRPDWHSLMRILNDVQASDEETLIFGITVINKTLHGIPDQASFPLQSSQFIVKSIDSMFTVFKKFKLFIWHFVLIYDF
jgi:FH1/FH2 domain-containing protein 3